MPNLQRDRESEEEIVRIAVYCRVSTEDQKSDLQLDAIRQYSQARSFFIHKEYVDFISGATSKRPALDEMLADARRRKFDALIVWKIDRLGRSVPHLLNVLAELQSVGVAFVSLQEAIDTSTPAGRMVFTFLGAVAEFERAIISERVRAGMAAAKKRGKHCGRNPISCDPKQVRALRNEGKSLRQIAMTLKTSHQTVANLLASAS